MVLLPGRMPMLDYLASPYSHPDLVVREYRYNKALEAMKKLKDDCLNVYSPIAMTHVASVRYDMRKDWEYWHEHCEAFVHASRSMHVLMLSGWQESVGVTAEIALAERLGIPVTFMEVV